MGDEPRVLADAEADDAQAWRWGSRARGHAALHAGDPVTLAALRALRDQELVQRYDALVNPELDLYRFGPDAYLDELRRREAERQGRRLEWLTWALVALTIVIAVATLALLLRGE